MSGSAKFDDYCLSESEKSHCSKCGEVVTMLAPFSMKGEQPWFYICFVCHRVSMIGVGEVKNSIQLSEKDIEEV